MVGAGVSVGVWLRNHPRASGGLVRLACSSGGVSCGMPIGDWPRPVKVAAICKPKAGAKLTAKEFESKHGAMVRREYGDDMPGARTLANALRARRAAIEVSEGVLKQWFANFVSPAGSWEKVSSARELDERYGHVVAELAKKHETPYLLSKALRKRDPPVVASEYAVNQWLIKYRVLGSSKNTEETPSMPVEMTRRP